MEACRCVAGSDEFLLTGVLSAPCPKCGLMPSAVPGDGDGEPGGPVVSGGANPASGARSASGANAASGARSGNGANAASGGRASDGAHPKSDRSSRVPDLDLADFHVPDRYQLVSVLGQGGMGVVLLGTQVGLDRPVAIKFLRNSPEPSIVKRFMREARLMAAVSHPNVVAVIEVGTAGDMPFIVTEFLHGGNLRELMKEKGRWPLDEALPLILDCLAGLAVLHERGIVHRDLKPENILLDAKGVPKLADLGLARSEDDGTRITRGNVIMGTPGYMSPEQVEGAEAGPPSDVYAMAVLLYELLAGRPVFQASSSMQLCMRHVNDVPPNIGTLLPSLPDHIVHAIHLGLAKQPARRPATAAEFAAALAPEPLAIRSQVLPAAAGPRAIASGAAIAPAAAVDPEPVVPVPGAGSGAKAAMVFLAVAMVLSGGIQAWLRSRRPEVVPSPVAVVVRPSHRPSPPPVASPSPASTPSPSASPSPSPALQGTRIDVSPRTAIPEPATTTLDAARLAALVNENVRALSGGLAGRLEARARLGALRRGDRRSVALLAAALKSATAEAVRSDLALALDDCEEPLWEGACRSSIPIQERLPFEVFRHHSPGSPARSAGQSIAIGIHGILLCLDARTGAEQWRASLQRKIRRLKALDGRLLVTVTDERRNEEKMFLDAATGERKGVVPPLFGRAAVSLKGDLLVGSPAAQMIQCVDFSTGAEVWSASYSQLVDGLECFDDVVVSLHRGGPMEGRRAATGKVVWSRTPGRGPGDKIQESLRGMTSNSFGIVEVTARQLRLVAVNNGATLWTYEGEPGLVGWNTMLSEEHVVIRTTANRLVCLGAKRGNRLWSVPIAHENPKEWPTIRGVEGGHVMVDIGSRVEVRSLQTGTVTGRIATPPLEAQLSQDLVLRFKGMQTLSVGRIAE